MRSAAQEPGRGLPRGPGHASLTGAGPGAAALSLIRRRVCPPSVTLFVCLFAAQAGLLVLSPILTAVADDLDVSTVAVGQLRAVSGAVAAAIAIVLSIVPRRPGMRSLLSWGLLLMLGASLASAAAPTFELLVAAQVPLAVGLAFVLSGGVAAAGRWTSGSGERTRVLSWALVGQPAAWIIGMPLAGVVGDRNWRLAWLVLPAVASALAVAAVRIRPRDGADSYTGPAVWRQPGVGSWAVGELFAYAGWAGTLVFAGALFVDAYQVSSATAGFLLAAAAVAYLPGNFIARRWADHAARPVVVAFALALAACAAVFGAVRPSLAWSAVVFALMGFLAGGRTLVGSALGLKAGRADALRAMSVRTTAVQLGYLLGAALGGIGLAIAGWSGLGLALTALFMIAVIPHSLALSRARFGRQRPGRPGGSAVAG